MKKQLMVAALASLVTVSGCGWFCGNKDAAKDGDKKEEVKAEDKQAEQHFSRIKRLSEGGLKNSPSLHYTLCSFSGDLVDEYLAYWFSHNNHVNSDVVNFVKKLSVPCYIGTNKDGIFD